LIQMRLIDGCLRKNHTDPINAGHRLLQGDSEVATL